MVGEGRDRAGRCSNRGGRLPRRAHAADAARRAPRDRPRHERHPTGAPFRVAVGEHAARPRDRRSRQSAGRLRAAFGRSPWRARRPAPRRILLTRPRICDRVSLGVRALDTLVPCGRGQRLGIFAGSGVGKSSLLGMIARSTTADVNVIALVGERGREVREFIERDLGDALAHSVVVVATSDQPALVRIRAAFTATAIAEHFRDQGRDVLLMMDSVTRFAMAQREIGLAIGEPPATRGYTPSVFALLPRLLERAGHERDRVDHRPVHRARRGRRHERAGRRRRALDPRRPRRAHALARPRRPLPGHRRAAERLPADRRDRHAGGPRRPASALRAALAAYREKEDLISIGAYQTGTDPVLDAAIACARRSTPSSASASTSRASSTSQTPGCWACRPSSRAGCRSPVRSSTGLKDTSGWTTHPDNNPTHGWEGATNAVPTHGHHGRLVRQCHPS